ncbi:hypothetical protein BU26DRAFT_414653 [Trematosphaeria pertusa]|uniref:Glycosyl transferase CAP10 domain-containing protein n=1 Tax=Trematosphaeria pertusa TaxID=390896 RepID=A0A6A6J4L5_9PLEO|nr:uncharacterized protein BU26DRAFT_414653 [Trematosphaeria pertusa]KAF2257468.1 hypothetical protein BU26DRAFT_414653 [Trematosphaeria pertusa]
MIDRPSLAAYGSNYGVFPTECNSKFLGLFKEIERSVTRQKGLGKVSPSAIDLSWKTYGAVRAMIYNQKLFIIEEKLDGKGYHSTRALAILHQLNRAVTTSLFLLPNIEFSFAVDDIADVSHAHHTIWAFSRLAIDDEIWLMPDFGYWSWPLELVGEYDQIRAAMRENEVEWDKKISKALWRGALKTNKQVRGALMRATRGKEWADVEEVTWKNMTDVTGGSAAAALPIAEHCAYKFLIHTEGHGYSGRGKYLLNCASIVIMHKAQWIEPHHHLLVRAGPHQNFVEVERDFSDLEEKVEELLQHPQRAEAIMNNSMAVFRDGYLTPTAQVCYWRQLFLEWAGVSSPPDPWEVVDGKNSLRGTPFETFV